MHLPLSTVATALSNQIEVEVDNLRGCTHAQSLSHHCNHEEQFARPDQLSINRKDQYGPKSWCLV